MTSDQDPPSSPSKKRRKTIKLGSGARGAQARQGGPKNYYPYDLCKQIVQQFQFKNRAAFTKWIQANYQKYPLVPLAPHVYYKSRDVDFSWADFLGDAYKQNATGSAPGVSRYCNYDEFAQFIKDSKIHSKTQYDGLYEQGLIPTTYPMAPASVYGTQWPGWIKLTGIDPRGSKGVEKIKHAIEADRNEETHQSTVLQLMPFHLFKQEVRRQCFSFKQQYYDWVKENRLTSKGFSNNPDSYYIKLGVWTDWYDVLGIFNPNTPTFAQKCSYIQAKKFVQGLGLKSIEEWRKWCEQNQDVRPDVPRYPDNFYNEWEGWDVYLGKFISEVMNTQRHNTAVLWIASTTKRFNNVFEISIDTNGIASAYEEVLIAKEYELVAMFEYEERVYNNVPLETIIKRIIDHNTVGTYERWIGGLSIRYDGVIIGNIHQLIYDLSEFLVQIPIAIPEHISVIKRKYEQTGMNNHQKSQSFNRSDDEYGVEDLL